MQPISSIWGRLAFLPVTLSTSVVQTANRTLPELLPLITWLGQCLPRLSAVKDPHTHTPTPTSYSPLWKEVTMHNPHLRGRDWCSSPHRGLPPQLGSWCCGRSPRGMPVVYTLPPWGLSIHVKHQNPSAQEDFCSPPFHYLIQSFVSVWTHGCLFYTLGYNPMFFCFVLFFLQIVLTGCRELFQLVSLSFWYTHQVLFCFFNTAFWHYVLYYLCVFCSWPNVSCFSRHSGFFYWRMVLEIGIWATRPTGLAFLLALSADKAKKDMFI